MLNVTLFVVTFMLLTCYSVSSEPTEEGRFRVDKSLLSVLGQHFGIQTKMELTVVKLHLPVFLLLKVSSIFLYWPVVSLSDYDHKWKPFFHF